MPDLLLTPRFWPCGAAGLVGFDCAPTDLKTNYPALKVSSYSEQEDY